MLERNFNELDNDFITVWSKLLTAAKDYIDELSLKESVYPALMALANLGQIDALQGVMMFNSLSKYMDERDLEMAVKKYDILNPKTRSLNEDIVLFTHATRLDKDDSKSFKTLISHHKKDKNPLVRERYLEVAAGRNINRQRSPYLCETLFRRKLRYLLAEKDYSPAIRANRFALGVDVMNTMRYQLVNATLVRVKLRKLTEKNDSPANRFAYAKNLYFFGSKKQRELGYYMLKDLANRELSETTKKETETIIQHIKEKDAEIFAKGIERELKQYEYGSIPRWL